MNAYRLKQAIAIMKRAGRVDMREYQGADVPPLPGQVPYFGPVAPEATAKTEQELHACGNAACFAGWIAVSPEFQHDGGQVGYRGQPLLDAYQCHDNELRVKLGVSQIDVVAYSISRWLDIDYRIADSLVRGDIDQDQFSAFYNKPWVEVNAQDLIEKLEQLLAQHPTEETA